MPQTWFMVLLLTLLQGGAEPDPTPGEIGIRSMAHPFLFFSAADGPALRAAAATDRKVQFDRLQRWGELFVDFDPLPPDELPSHRDILQVYHENAAAFIVNMSLLYHLTGEQRYFLAAHRWLEAFCRYPADTGGNYSVGAYALAVAAGYDMLYPWLSNGQRDHIRAHLVAILDRGRQGARTDWWAGLRAHHDHWLPAAGLCVGAAAVAAETPGGRERLRFFMDHFRLAISAIGEDGAWTEGAATWVYTMSMTLIAFDACRRVTGDDLFELPFVQRTAAYRLYQWLPDDQFIYHHDSFRHGRYNVMGAAAGPILRKLAGEMRDGRAQWLADLEEEIDFRALEAGTAVNSQWSVSKQHLYPPLFAAGWGFLWYDPSVKATPPEGLPNHIEFANQGLVILRSGWKKQDTVFTFTCAPLGGHQVRAEVLAGDTRITANMGHTHALAGAFNLYAHGNYLAVPPGYGMRESRHNNTLTIQGADQRLDPRGEARILRREFGNDLAYIAGEAAGCYPDEAGVDRWIRHVAWIAPDMVVMGDELAARGTGEASATRRPAAGSPVPAPAADRQTIWRMNYAPTGQWANDVTLDAERQSFLVAAEDPNRSGALTVRFLAPADMVLETEIVKGPGGRWTAFGQVRAAMGDIFRHSPRAEILAVLTATEDPSTAVPPTRAVQCAPAGEAFGAAVDLGAESQAVVFIRQDATVLGDEPLTVRAVAGRTLTWRVFSLPPDTAFDVTVSSRPIDGRQTVLHTITLRRGAGTKTSAAGTLIVTSGPNT